MLTDVELAEVRGVTGVHHLSTWAALYTFVLHRPVSHDEVVNAHRRINGPIAPGQSIADIIRTTKPMRFFNP